jgi:hypothetical protein
MNEITISVTIQCEPSRLNELVNSILERVENLENEDGVISVEYLGVREV